MLSLFLIYAVLTGTANAATPVISVNPNIPDSIEPGDTFLVDINITGVEAPGIVQWMIRLEWEPTILNFTVVGGEPVLLEGTFLNQGQAGKTMFLYTGLNNTIGQFLEITCVLMVTGTRTGSGRLCIANFTAIGPGADSAIRIWGSAILDEEGNELPHNVQNATVTVIPEFPAAAILPMLMITTTLVLLIAKTVFQRKRRVPILP
jgi:hypothetical protein